MPTNRPDTRMMMSESTPLKYISRMVRPKRRNAVPECSSVARKKRAAKPMRQIPWIVPCPRFSIDRLSMRALQSEVLAVGRRRVVERDGAVGLAVHELVNVRQAGCADLVRRALGDDHAFRNEINVVHDL